MKPEAKIAKKYLGQVYDLGKEIKKITDDIKELETKITRITPSYSDMPKSEHSGNSNENKLHEYIEEKIFLNSELRKRKVEKEKLSAVFEKQIDLLNKKTYRDILKYRFLDCMTWEEIVKLMKRLDIRNSRRLCERALKNFYEKNTKIALVAPLKI